jgi:hypothetical protein
MLQLPRRLDARITVAFVVAILPPLSRTAQADRPSPRPDGARASQALAQADAGQNRTQPAVARTLEPVGPGADPGPTGLALPPPAPMKTVQRPRLGLTIAGACVLGSVWLPTAFLGYVIDKPAEMIPLVGPLFGWNSRGDADARLQNVGLLVVTLAQTTGAAMLISGLATRQTLSVRDSPVTLVPILTTGGGGLGMAGAF